MTLVIVALVIYSATVHSHHVGLVLYRTGFQQYVPLTYPQIRPTCNAKKYIVIEHAVTVSVPRPHRETYIVTGNQFDFPPLILHYHLLIAGRYDLRFFGKAEKVCLIVVLHAVFGYEEMTIVEFAVLLYEQTARNRYMLLCGKLFHKVQSCGIVHGLGVFLVHGEAS